MDGIISLTLKALSLQLATLMDEAGGDTALKMLDKLASLNPQTRKEVLGRFTEILDELSTKEDSSYIPGEAEEKLFKSILSEIEEGTFTSERKLQILSGPQNRERAGELIDLQSFRQKHKH